MLRRVLALAGFTALAVQIAAAFLPPAAFLPLAAVLCLTALLLWKQKPPSVRRNGVLLMLCVAAVCLVWRTAYLELRVRPIQERAGTTAAVEATVLETRPGYAAGLVYATVRVETVNGERLAMPFSVSVDQMPFLESGERFRAPVTFAPLNRDAYRLSSYADGVYLGAGVVMLLVYGAMLARRKSDALTSLGAALLLLLGNPFAALDAGLLLSFGATLGVLCAHALWREKRGAAEREAVSPWKRWGLKHLQAAAISAGATLGTLPVLILLRSGISLLTLICNLLVVPVLPLTICFGFCTAAASAPLLSVLAGPAGLLCGLCLRWILTVARLAAAVPGAFVHITGEYAFGVCLLLYGLLFAAWKWRVSLRRTLAGCTALVLCAVLLYGAVQGNTVTAIPCGSAENTPVLLLQRSRAVVLYRGPETAVRAVLEELEQHNRTGIDLLIDLRPDGDAAALAEQLPAKDTFTVAQDCINHATFRPFYDTIITVKRQAEGNFACVEAGGCKLGVSSGAVDVSPYPPFDVYFGGSSAVKGLHCKTLILSRAGRAWTRTADAQTCLTGSVQQAQLSPRGTWALKEEWYGITG